MLVDQIGAERPHVDANVVPERKVDFPQAPVSRIDDDLSAREGGYSLWFRRLSAQLYVCTFIFQAAELSVRVFNRGTQGGLPVLAEIGVYGRWTHDTDIQVVFFVEFGSEGFEEACNSEPGRTQRCPERQSCDDRI